MVKVYENQTTGMLYVRTGAEGRPEGARVLMVVAPDGTVGKLCEACNGQGEGIGSDGEPMECPCCGGVGAE